MPHIITTAKGERVDLDVIKIKGQLAQAPMNVEVARRKSLLDGREEKPRRQPVFDPLANLPEAEAALADLRTESKAVVVPGQPETFEEPAPAPVATNKKK